MKILVPTDLLPTSRATNEYASFVAKIFNAEIVLFHVFTKPPFFVDSLIKPEVNKEPERLPDFKMDQEIRYLQSRYDVEIHGIVRMGIIADEISHVSQENKVALIVMTRGNTVSTVIRRVRTPVLIVNKSTAMRPFSHIVFATDFHLINDPGCLEILFSIVEKYSAMLQVLHVNKGNFNTEPGQLRLEEILARVTHWYRQIESDTVVYGIKNFVETHPAELLVLLSHNHNLFNRVFGSIYPGSLSAENQLPLLILTDK